MDYAVLGYKIDSGPLVSGKRHLREFGEEGTRAGRSAERMGLAAKKGLGMVAIAATAALGALASIGTAIGTISQFESSMSKLGAISGATASELTAMRDIARDLGATTEFSATQAADGLNFLSMAGFSASESMAAIPAVLDLATASGMGLAEAADTASNIMSGFGIAAENAAGVADILAAAASRANTDVSQLGQAMSTVAPISAALEISLADTAAAIGLLSDAGIQGSRAGTALRGVLASLAGPSTEAVTVLNQLGLTIQDIDPATNDLSVVMQRLGAAGLTTAQAMKIFGREAASGALVLVEGASRLGDFGDELERVDGAAMDMADTMRDNLGGDIQGLQSAVSGLMLSLGDAGLTAVLRGVVQAITGMARVISSVVDALAGLGQAFGNFAFGADKAQVATDNLTLAMGDEIGQAAKLLQALSDGKIMSVDVAGVKIEQARAHLAAADAARQDAAAQIQLTDEYKRQQAIIDGNRRILQQYRELEAQGEVAGQFEADQIGRLNRELKEAVETQRQMVAEAGATSDEYLAVQAEIAELEAAINSAEGGMVSLGGEITTANELTDRLSTTAGGINFDAGISSAQSLADWLGISLSRALQLSAVTPQMSDEDAAMSQQVIPDAGMREGQRGAVESFNRLTASSQSGGGGGASSGKTEAQRELNRLMQEGQSIMDGLRTEQERHNEAIEQANRLYAVGALDLEGYLGHVQNLEQEFAEMQFAPMIDGLTSISDGMIDAIANGDNLLQSFTQMIGQMALEAVKADIGGLISGAFGGGGGSPAAGLLGLGKSLFGGFRADGGDVSPSKAYVVGERGPELFMPSSAGQIIPNGGAAPSAQPQQMQPQSTGKGVEVVVLDDPRKIDEYRTSPQGERARTRADRRLR